MKMSNQYKIFFVLRFCYGKFSNQFVLLKLKIEEMGFCKYEYNQKIKVFEL